ncbi:MAG TPA: sigma-70 family RNA polymerase sigma factor [Chloroflexota bacterium]
MRRGGESSGSTSSDEDLVAACLVGDQTAWQVLVNRYAALVYSVALKYGLTEADAADVFQSVCITLLDKLATIREPRGLAAWLITTTSRQALALARLRQRERARGASEELSASAAELADPELLPDEEVLSFERQFLVRKAVSQLPPRCRQLVEALFSDTAQQTSYQQLADLLGVSINSLGPTRARCLAHLRRLLVESGFST